MICFLWSNGYMPQSFLAVWALVIFLTVLLFVVMSGSTFHWLYQNADHAKWQYKTNGKYPSVQMVRKEFLQTLKGVFFAGVFPALALYLGAADQGEDGSQQDQDQQTSILKSLLPKSQAYCGLDQTSYLQMLQQFLLIIATTDFFEFFYHWIGHRFDSTWTVHRHHHCFYNPTPFAVIADEPFDNMMRASPLLILPIIFPLNMDLLFYTFAVFFYGYGVYLHCGYEADFIISSDHWLVNTSFQHYIHHAVSTRRQPYHCGFFVKIWDQLWGITYPKEEELAQLAKTKREKGERSLEKWVEYRYSCGSGSSGEGKDSCTQFPNYRVLNPFLGGDGKGGSACRFDLDHFKTSMEFWWTGKTDQEFLVEVRKGGNVGEGEGEGGEQQLSNSTDDTEIETSKDKVNEKKEQQVEQQQVIVHKATSKTEKSVEDVENEKENLSNNCNANDGEGILRKRS